MYEYINYFCENRYCISSSQIFLSFYFSHFFFLFFAPIFSIFLSFPSPPFFTDRSFAPRKAQRSLAQEILIFRGAEGARPLCEPWWITVPVFRMRERVSSQVHRRSSFRRQGDSIRRTRLLRRLHQRL